MCVCVCVCVCACACVCVCAGQHLIGSLGAKRAHRLASAFYFCSIFVTSLTDMHRAMFPTTRRWLQIAVAGHDVGNVLALRKYTLGLGLYLGRTNSQTVYVLLDFCHGARDGNCGLCFQKKKKKRKRKNVLNSKLVIFADVISSTGFSLPLLKPVTDYFEL